MASQGLFALVILGGALVLFGTPSLGSLIPPISTAFSDLNSRAADLPVNCTGRRCQLVHQLTYDEMQRIGMIKKKILEQIHAGLHRDRMTSSPKPEVRSTPKPSTTSQSPLSLTEDIVTLAEDPELPNATAKNVVQFKILGQVPDHKLEVKKADLWVMVRLNGRTRKKRNRRQGTTKRRRGRKIHLKISSIKDVNSRKSRDIKGGNQGEILSEVRMRVRKTQWQKFGMPLKLIQDMVDDPSKKLSLKVDCKGCGRKVEPVLLYRQKRKTKAMRRKRKKRKLSKKRPLLIIHLSVLPPT